jgi:NAD(P)-dependent dehydrogenase (short-subunit alcohol dehydrogenase family)
MSAMEFEGKLIVITGGAGGIARETARLLLDGGAELLLIDPSVAALEASAAELAGGERVRRRFPPWSRQRPAPPRSPASRGRSTPSYTSPVSFGRMRSTARIARCGTPRSRRT